MSKNIWNTETVTELIGLLSCGKVDIAKLKDKPFYRNDYTLKKAGITFDITAEEMSEIVACNNDPIYFIEKFCKVKTIDGYQNIHLRDYQKDLIQHYLNNRFSICLTSRKCGSSTCTALFLLWYAMNNSDKTIVLFSPLLLSAIEHFNKIVSTIESLPFYIKPCIRKLDKKMIEFENGSRIMAKTASSKSDLGLTIDVSVLLDFAHNPDAISNPLYDSLYPLSVCRNDSRMIISSTPKGNNLFYQLWTEANSNADSQFKPIRVDWYQVPGRDEKWKQNMIKVIGSEEAFNREYGLSFESE